MRGSRLVTYICLIAGIWFLMDLYAIQGIKVLLASGDRYISDTVPGLYWLISAVILASFIYQLQKYFTGRKTAPSFRMVFNAFIILFVSRLTFIAVLFLEDLYRLVIGLWSSVPERSLIVSSLGLLVAFIPFSAFWFGITRGKYHYKVRKLRLEFEDLPAGFDGFRIVQISDIHAGSFDDPEEVRRGIELLNSQKPDLFVFTGDLVNNSAAEIQPYLDIFRAIEAPYGKFSVLGNHDYGDYTSWPDIQSKRRNLEQLRTYHAELGWQLLLDTHASVRKGTDQIRILGVENWGVGFGHRGDLEMAVNGLSRNDFKILLSHDPTHWESEVKTHSAFIHLTLSGHTHGMQFGIEAFGLKWSPVQYRYRNWAGLAEENGRYLYINRGFGFLGFSGRVGIWPEITVLELRKRVI